MKPGILLMVRELHHGGSERQMTETALALDRTRFAPHVGAFITRGIRGDELRAAGVPVVHVPVRSFKSPGTLIAARILANYIRSNHIQLVHTFDLPLTAWAIPATLYLTKAVALASQRCHLDLASPWLRKALLFAERRGDGVVVNCKFLARHLIADAGIRPDRIHLCYNGIDLARFHSMGAARPAALRPNALVIGTVCVLRPEKGLSTLVDAFALVGNLAPNLRLAIVGSGPMLPELQRRASELGILDACVFEPATSQVTDWLGNIDIFVLPSLSEAFSNSLMEAMACGCCAVASDVGGNPELIEDGASGLLFPSGDKVALANALRNAILHPDLRQRLADAGRDIVRTNFSREIAARRMGEIYSGLLEKQSGTFPDDF
jgi:glycosyltransferase involved in cell wall biosynthesis